MENFTLKPLEIKQVQKILESKEIDGIVECLKALEIHAESIGEGGNAEVFAVAEGQFANVCLKKVKETPQLLCNTIERENALQSRAEKAGVRTPLPLVAMDTEKGKFFIMEKIQGMTVEQALAQPSKITEAFEVALFMKDLEMQVNNMHRAGIYHRDLHTRNVMINEEGLPVIIDFGTATEGTGSDFTYEELANVYDPVKKGYKQVAGMFKDDLQMVRNLRSAIIPLSRRRVDKSV